MLKINDVYISANLYDVLILLRTHLNLKGIHLLGTIKNGVDNIQVSCPIHNNGQEKHASCGIRVTSIDGVNSGQVHCFACGYTTTLDKFISDCFGVQDNGKYGRKWLIHNFSSINSTSRPKLDLNFTRANIKQSIKYISEEELESYRYYHPYMYKRGLTDDIIDRYDIGYDKETKCITMPVRDETGGTLFFCRRSVVGKFFNYPTNVDKPVYGLYELNRDAKELVVCESVFNALTCVKYGKEAVALLGTGTTNQYKQIQNLPIRKILLGFDGDTAGDAACIRFKKNVKNKLIYKYILPRGKDINDLTKEQFDSMELIPL